MDACILNLCDTSSIAPLAVLKYMSTTSDVCPFASRTQGTCEIYSRGSLTLRNVSVASSESSCPSNNMLNLGETTTIHCPLGWWIPPSPLSLPLINFTGCPHQCALGHFGNTSQEKEYTCSGECNRGGNYCPAATVQPFLCPAGTYLPVGVAGLVEASCIPCAPGAYNPDEGGASVAELSASLPAGAVTHTNQHTLTDSPL